MPTRVVSSLMGFIPLHGQGLNPVQVLGIIFACYFYCLTCGICRGDLGGQGCFMYSQRAGTNDSTGLQGINVMNAYTNPNSIEESFPHKNSIPCACS